MDAIGGGNLRLLRDVSCPLRLETEKVLVLLLLLSSMILLLLLVL